MGRRSHHSESRHRAESASPHDADTEAAPEIVMFFLGPDGEFLDEDPHAAPRRTLADVRRAWRAALESEATHDPFARNRLGPRPVQGTGRPAKTGYRDEIIVTARSSPERAVAAAVGRVFLANGESVGRGRGLDHESPLRARMGCADRIVAMAAPTGQIASLCVTVAQRDRPGTRARESPSGRAQPLPASRQSGDERVARPSRCGRRVRLLIVRHERLRQEAGQLATVS